MHADRAQRLFEAHRLPIYRYLLRSTGRRAVAEDLTQEVFVRALRAAPVDLDSVEERPWLFRVARNLVVDRWRRTARRSPSEGIGESVADVGSRDDELRLELAQALESLPDPDREAFLLSAVAGLTYAEAATAMETTVASVRSRIFRARCALRGALGAQRETPTAARRAVEKGAGR